MTSAEHSSSTKTMSSRQQHSTLNPRSLTATDHTVHFSGVVIKATVTRDAPSIDNWIHTIRQGQPTFVGLDCEWRPNFVRGQNNKVATLQLCVGTRCLIVRLFRMTSIPQSLKNFLNDSILTFVGVGVGSDVLKLRNDYGLECQKWIDLVKSCRSYLGERLSGQQLGLKGYAKEILGLAMNKPKRVTMSNWEARNLSEEQVQYACVDAYVSYRLGIRMLQGH